MTIRFGTDGWRALLGKDFTPENCGQLAQAFADVYPQLAEAGRPVIVGFDRRRRSKETADLVASVLLANNISVYLSKEYCPTPCVSWWVKNRQAAAGIMVTASHNPPNWNGIKFKESYGGAASAEYLKPIEDQIDCNAAAGKKPKKISLKSRNLTYFNPKKEFLEAQKALVNLQKIKEAGFKILFDPMYGAGSGFLETLLGSSVTTLHGEADPDFGGLHPEPIRPYVNDAMEKMKTGNYSVCLINDGDADRIGAVDENGNYITSHLIFALLLEHLVEHQKRRGKVLKSISTTVMIDRLCQKYGLPMEVTKVGFKYLSPAMKKKGVLIGGEESGGIGMPHHICERDGIYCALLLLDLMATRGKLLGELIAEIQKEHGPCYYKRVDLKLSKEKILEVKEKLAVYEPSELAGVPFKKKNPIDGYHFQMGDESWLLIRPSGTEPLLRIYAEAPTVRQVETLLSEAGRLIQGE